MVVATTTYPSALTVRGFMERVPAELDQRSGAWSYGERADGFREKRGIGAGIDREAAGGPFRPDGAGFALEAAKGAGDDGMGSDEGRGGVVAGLGNNAGFQNDRRAAEHPLGAGGGPGFEEERGGFDIR